MDWRPRSSICGARAARPRGRRGHHQGAHPRARRPGGRAEPREQAALDRGEVVKRPYDPDVPGGAHVGGLSYAVIQARPRPSRAPSSTSRPTARSCAHDRRARGRATRHRSLGRAQARRPLGLGRVHRPRPRVQRRHGPLLARPRTTRTTSTTPGGSSASRRARTGGLCSRTAPWSASVTASRGCSSRTRSAATRSRHRGSCAAGWRRSPRLQRTRGSCPRRHRRTRCSPPEARVLAHPVVVPTVRPMFGRVLAIALNTYRESVRARILLGLAGVAFAVAFYSLIVGAYTLRTRRASSAISGAASISLFSIAVAVIIGATSLHRELEQKTNLPDPGAAAPSREYLVGKYLGTLLTMPCSSWRTRGSCCSSAALAGDAPALSSSGAARPQCGAPRGAVEVPRRARSARFPGRSTLSSSAPCSRARPRRSGASCSARPADAPRSGSSRLSRRSSPRSRRRSSRRC